SGARNSISKPPMRGVTRSTGAVTMNGIIRGFGSHFKSFGTGFISQAFEREKQTYTITPGGYNSGVNIRKSDNPLSGSATRNLLQKNSVVAGAVGVFPVNNRLSCRPGVKHRFSVAEIVRRIRPPF